VSVVYGGDNLETYVLGGDSTPGVLFCDPVSNGHGAGGQAGAAGRQEGTLGLDCTLWVEGGATVQVSGGVYSTVEVNLSPDSDDCGALTVEEEIILGSAPEMD
jgi:hypothetical protein